MPDRVAGLRALAAARWRVALALTLLMVLNYFGFVALIAFRRDTLAALVRPGLSVGILLGALVILVSWVLTWAYVRWANKHYDTELARLRGMSHGGPA
jgi:uncharacterized membrane protein (DUF485 family)